jgi:hypothetical protein
MKTLFLSRRFYLLTNPDYAALFSSHAAIEESNSRDYTR